MINTKILEIFEDFSIDEEEGIPYLLSLYFGYEPGYFPIALKIKINSTGIVTTEDKDTKDLSNLQWHIPLFEEVDSNFDWVIKEYLPLFKDIGKSSNAKDVLIRMKNLFRENPSIRKDEVMKATELYLQNTDIRYIRLPHYFIKKGRGAEVVHDLLTWVETYREIIKDTPRQGLNNKLQ